MASTIVGAFLLLSISNDKHNSLFNINILINLKSTHGTNVHSIHPTPLEESEELDGPKSL